MEIQERKDDFSSKMTARRGESSLKQKKTVKRRPNQHMSFGKRDQRRDRA